MKFLDKNDFEIELGIHLFDEHYPFYFGKVTKLGADHVITSDGFSHIWGTNP